MTPFLRRYHALLAVSITIAVSVVLLYGSTQKGYTPTFIDNATARVTGSVRHVYSSAWNGINGLWSHYLYLVDVQKRNDSLELENRRLRKEIQRLGASVRENEQLRNMLAFREQMPFGDNLVISRVIGRETTPFFRVLKIVLDVADIPHIEPRSPVLSDMGVVGQIFRIHGSYADVLLLSDPRVSIDVYIERNRARGILRGIGSHESYRCQIDYLLRSDNVREGDTLVTSGVDKRFPPGLTVGTITKVIRRKYGLYQEVEVEPAVDFGRLDEVFILTAPPPPASKQGDTP